VGWLDTNVAQEPWAAAILLHPHPEYGGHRHNHVIDALFRGLAPLGVSTARFDFASAEPGVAASQVADAIALVETRPLALVGYSFGADVAATVIDPEVSGWFLLTPPLSLSTRADIQAFGADPRPKAVAAAEHDQFSALGRTRHLTEGWANTDFEIVPGADHFLNGSTNVVLELAAGWLQQRIAYSPPA